jgi:hypothetical protein
MPIRRIEAAHQKLIELRVKIGNLNLSTPADREKQREMMAEMSRLINEIIQATDEILKSSSITKQA